MHIAFQNIGLSSSIGKPNHQQEEAALFRMPNFQAATNQQLMLQLQIKPRSFHHQSWSDKISMAHLCRNMTQCIEVAIACAPQ